MCLQDKWHVPVAQWIARWTSNPEVAGSNPAGDAFLFYNREIICSFSVVRDSVRFGPTKPTHLLCCELAMKYHEYRLQFLEFQPDVPS